MTFKKMHRREENYVKNQQIEFKFKGLYRGVNVKSRKNVFRDNCDLNFVMSFKDVDNFCYYFFFHENIFEAMYSKFS